MNNLKELIQKYSAGKDPKAMEGITDIIGDFLKNNVSEDAYSSLYKDIYSELVGGHYNKEFADEQIAKMYYTGASGEKHFAPYWTENEAKDIYEKVKAKIPAEYNFYDFEVVLNMIKSDYCLLLAKWYKEEHPQAKPSVSTDATPTSPTADATKPATEATGIVKPTENDADCEKWCKDKVTELAVNWLDDDDNPFGAEKAWGYFNS